MYSKEKRHEYYLKNREKILELNRNWRQKNKEKFYESVYKYRKRKADELKALGIDYAWHSEKKRKQLYEKRSERVSRTFKEKEIPTINNE